MSLESYYKQYFDNILILDYYAHHKSIKDSIINKAVFSNKIILNYLNKPKLKIVDLGCGVCDLERLMVKKKIIDKKTTIIAIDRSLNMLKNCSHLKPNPFNLESIIADALFSPIAKNSIDIIFAINITPYIDNIKQLVSEVSRISKHEGLLIMISPKKSIFWNEEFDNIKPKFWDEMSNFFESNRFELIEDELIKMFPIPDVKSIEVEIADLSIFKRL